jgi:transcriptional regulator with XRE-family HTH domain
MDEAKCRREFAARLKAARKAAGLTQKKLAALAGVSQTTITFWETARRPVSMVDFIAVADGLGVPAASLLPGTPPPAPVVFKVDGPLVCEKCDTRRKPRKRRIRPVMRRAR